MSAMDVDIIPAVENVPPATHASFTSLPSRPHVHNDNGHTLSNSPAPSNELLSIEDWDSKFPPIEPKSVPPPSTSKAKLPPPIVPLPAVQTTGEAAKKFNDLCQIRRLVPYFTYEELYQACFTAKVEFGPHVCEDSGPFPSKKQGKEAVAQRALDLLRSLGPASAHKVAPSTAIVPLPAVQTTGEAASNFNRLCQIHSMLASFYFKEVAKGCFAAKVEFGSYVCEDEGPFPSTKQAKDAVASQALVILESLEVPQKTKRRIPESDFTSTETNAVPRLDDANWMGRLTEYTQRCGCRSARLQTHEADNRLEVMSGSTLNPIKYACTLQLDPFPDRVFGSATDYYSTKNEAKRRAARDAVLWLQDNGILSASEVQSPSKRRKSTNADEHDQAIPEPTTDQSYAQRVVDRSIRLGLTQPQYKLKPCSAPSDSIVKAGFCMASANYSDRDVEREPRLAGPMCQTPPVYGQKNAKEVCCRELLGLLDSLILERGTK